VRHFGQVQQYKDPPTELPRNNSSNWQSEKAERERERATVRTPSDVTVNHVTLVNSAANIVTWNSSVSPHDKYQSDQTNCPKLSCRKIGCGFYS